MNSKKLPRKKNLSTMRMVGKQMQAARKAAGFTQSSLGKAVLADEETIASIEQGRRPLLLELAQALDELLDTKGTLAAGVENMPEIDQFPLFAEQYMVHEREAISLCWYDNAVLPGLLQTRDYARAVLRERVPPYDEDELEAKTEGRIERQEILHRKCPPMMSFIVWEPVLYIELGGRKSTATSSATYASAPNSRGSPSSFYPCAPPHTPDWTAPSPSWRRPITSTWPTPRANVAASGFLARTRCPSWRASMRCCGHRP